MIAVGVDPGLHATAWAAVEYVGTGPISPGKKIDGLWLKGLGVWVGGKGLKGTEACLDMIQAIDPVGPSCHHPDVLVVESQQVYEGKSRKGKPEDLIRLATISGAVLRCCWAYSMAQTLNPLPREWKGNVEKSVPQARACLALGLTYRLAGGKDPAKQWVVPYESRGFADADWKNLMDAVALAIWGLRNARTGPV